MTLSLHRNLKNMLYYLNVFFFSLNWVSINKYHLIFSLLKTTMWLHSIEWTKEEMRFLFYLFFCIYSENSCIWKSFLFLYPVNDYFICLLTSSFLLLLSLICRNVFMNPQQCSYPWHWKQHLPRILGSVQSSSFLKIW